MIIFTCNLLGFLLANKLIDQPQPLVMGVNINASMLQALVVWKKPFVFTSFVKRLEAFYQILGFH
jgi:hypothetical protein